MTHPDPKCNESQAKFLSECPAEHRRFHELLFIVGNATYRYHKEARNFNPTIEDYEEWIEGLPENIGSAMRKEGFEKAKSVLSFTRYVLEKNDIGLEEYLERHIEPQDYEEYKLLSKNEGV